MASETQVEQALSAAELWPPDDTEESVVGTDLHQETIVNLRWGINGIAQTLTPPGGPRPWQALSQTIITGFSRPDGTRYKTLPDIFVYRRPIDKHRGSLAIGVDGPPSLIIEVLSESNYDSDLDTERGKAFSYARAGVREYLALDPTGAFLPEQARGWRLQGGVYQPWTPDGEGRWRSAEIAVAFGVEGMHVGVYSLDGERQTREDEIAQERAHVRALEAELAELRRLVEDLRQQRQ